MSKLWGGRFEKSTNRFVEAFTTSIAYDTRLWEVDIRASQAHARMLGAMGILEPAEAARLIEGLSMVEDEIRSGVLKFGVEAEDIHSEVERLLTAKVGPVAGKLHTARSRNDQVATDTRLFLRGEIDQIHEDIRSLQLWLCEKSERNLQTVMPGVTHMQHAQPVSLAHHLMAYFWMFERDRDRLEDLRKRMNFLPLGAAALAGTSFQINRQMVAKELGFDGVCENSLDAVSDRDFVVEFLSDASLIMMHLSRLAEELILWSTPEFGFVVLDDSVTTGSSIMPQKKNPDVAELIRGRVGRVYGQLVAALTTLKALPLSYNRDLQEDKVQLFESIETVRSCLSLMRLILSTAEFRVERMKEVLRGDFSNATDLADDLVRKGMPFRQAHEVVGGIVVHCMRSGVPLEDLLLEDLKPFSTLFDERTTSLLSHHAVMSARSSEGGTSPESVRRQIERAYGTLGYAARGPSVGGSRT